MNLDELGHAYYTAMYRVLTEQSILFRPITTALSARHVSIMSRLKNSSDYQKVVKLSEPIALEGGSDAVVINRYRRFVQAQFQLPEQHWQSFTRADVRADEIGVARISRKHGNQTVKFELLDQLPHTLAAGATGSGKTEMMKSSLIALINTHTPDKLGIGIIDPKRDKYREFENVAHMVSPIAKDANEIKDLIAWFGSEYVRRRNNSEFIANGGKRLVLVVDEAQDGQVIGMKVDKSLNTHNLSIIHKLATQGREYGIHLFIGTQKPERDNLPGILDNLDNRYVGKVVDAKASSNATGLPGVGAHLLTAQGDFLYVPNAFDVVRFQVAMATAADYDRLPRVEAVVPAVPESATAVFNVPTKRVGRPKKCPQPNLVARYIIAGPDNISLAFAAEKFNLSRTEHERNRNFATRLIKEINRLRELKRRIEHG